MQTNSSHSQHLGTRIDREAAYWDRVYDSEDGEFQNCSWMEYVEQTTFNARYFRKLLARFQNKRILSIGGGIDRIGVELAKQGHQVVCVDISPSASVRTGLLAEEANVAHRLVALASSCEEMQFAPESFDVVVCKRALHHMDIRRVIPIVYSLLAEGGVFLAEEPVCLSGLVRWVHRRFPFYGDQPHTPDEKELTFDDIRFIKNAFASTRIIHFDLIARESVAYQLNKRRWNRLLHMLGRADYYLANRLVPPLKPLCNYVMIYATKS